MALAALQPTLRMSAVDGALLANGKPFRLKGVTWWGAESAHALPGGLERRSLDELLGMLARYGFNAIKLPFLHQHVLFDEDVPLASFDSHLNPQLLENGRPLKYVAAIRAIARRAASHGLLVFLVAHSLEGLWYSRAISEATVLDSWTALSRQYAHTHSSFLFSFILSRSLFAFFSCDRLCPVWNIAGVELKNRPWAASWGRGKPIDWDRAATRIGTHVSGKCNRWLIGVDGVGPLPGAAQEPEMEFAAMFPEFGLGENLVGARKAPIELSDHTRLVYMPHTYGTLGSLHTHSANARCLHTHSLALCVLLLVQAPAYGTCHTWSPRTSRRTAYKSGRSTFYSYGSAQRRTSLRHSS